MSTSKDQIRHWLSYAVVDDCTHLIVVCDTFDHEDYPVYIRVGQDVRKIADDYDGKNMQKIMEVYNLSLPLEPQLAEHRAFHY